MNVEDYVRVSQAREQIHLSKDPKDIAMVRAIVTQTFGLHNGSSTSEDTKISSVPSDFVHGSTEAKPTQALDGSDFSTLTDGENFIVGGEQAF